MQIGKIKNSEKNLDIETEKLKIILIIDNSKLPISFLDYYLIFISLDTGSSHLLCW